MNHESNARRMCPREGCQRDAPLDGVCVQHTFLESDLYHTEKRFQCAYVDCPMPQYVRKLCRRHYNQFIGGVEPTPHPMTLAKQAREKKRQARENP